MDESKEINSSDPKREKVRVIPLSAIDDAPEHPFGVRDDEEMAELVESISTFGVMNPILVRKWIIPKKVDRKSNIIVAKLGGKPLLCE